MASWAETFAQYLPLVDDPSAFLSALSSPLPVCFWVNPLKAQPEVCLAYLQSAGVVPEPVSWYPGAYRVRGWERPGATLAFLAGWYYVQEEIALTAVVALDPQPGERIVDLCASPGGKTAQIALKVGSQGLVVANEAQMDRLSGLRATVDRMGLLNVVVTWGDGRWVPLAEGQWDRVLLDAPCTGEGTVRKPAKSFKAAPEGFRRTVQALQKKLLQRALALAKTGGVVVYSTCTFSPDENEAVLDAALGDWGYVEPFEIPGLQSAPGITAWQGKSFRPDVVHAKRFWPHLNDTGGFFVARIRRTDVPLATETRPLSRKTPAFAPASWEPVDTLAQRFGIEPELLQRFRFWQRGSRLLWVALPHVQPLEGVTVEGLGMPLLQHTPRGPKPKTFALQYLAPWIRASVVELADEAAAWRFVSGQSQNLVAEGVSPGYVLVRFGPFALGCGLYGRGQLHSLMPKALQVQVG